MISEITQLNEICSEVNHDMTGIEKVECRTVLEKAEITI